MPDNLAWKPCGSPGWHACAAACPRLWPSRCLCTATRQPLIPQARTCSCHTQWPHAAHQRDGGQLDAVEQVADARQLVSQVLSSRNTGPRGARLVTSLNFPSAHACVAAVQWQMAENRPARAVASALRRYSALCALTHTVTSVEWISISANWRSSAAVSSGLHSSVALVSSGLPCRIKCNGTATSGLEVELLANAMSGCARRPRWSAAGCPAGRGDA